jgi:hypothetical protein
MMLDYSYGRAYNVRCVVRGSTLSCAIYAKQTYLSLHCETASSIAISEQAAGTETYRVLSIAEL